MPAITLISDLKLRDPYVSIIKAGIMSVAPEFAILDITHAVAAGSNSQTAYLLASSYPHFPQGTLHLNYTNCFLNKELNPVLVEYDGHYFMGADNGFFSIFIDSNNYKATIYSAKNELQLFLVDKMQKMVQWFYQGAIEQHTIPYPSLQKQITQKPFFNQLDNKIEGSIVYIDSFCNAITNIPTEMFQMADKNGNFEVKIENSTNIIRNYFDSIVPKEIEFYLTSNILGFIEIRMNGGRIAPLTGIQVGDRVEIIFS